MKAFSSFIDYIKIERRYSDHTVRAYSDDISQFNEYLLNSTTLKDLNAVSKDDIRQWVLVLMNDGNSARTLRRKIASLNSFYKYCLKNKWIHSNPAGEVILPKIDHKLPEFINETSIDYLFQLPQLNEGFSGLRDRVVLELFYATGIRLSELIGLRIGSYDRNRGEIKVLGKRSKERLVPLVPKMQDLIDKYLLAREKMSTDHNVFIVTDKGAPAYARMIQRLVRKYLVQSTTLEKKSPHMLRHTFATHMLNNGADLNAVKELLGHANLAATEIYTHTTYEKLKSIYKQAHPRA